MRWHTSSWYLWGLQTFAALFFTACLLDRGGDSTEPPIVDADYRPAKPVAPAGWPAIAWPEDNPYTPEKDILGRRLFFDPALSLTRDRACAWCHGPEMAFTDIRHTAFGTATGDGIVSRNTPTLANMVFARTFMLDGRDSTLEEQALGPLYSPHEMNMTEMEVVSRLEGDTAYIRLFEAAYGPGPILLERMTGALATYVRTLISANAPYDRWKAGDANALSESAARGEALFSGKADCARCHVPPLFTDGRNHNVGLGLLEGFPADFGRGAVTGDPDDDGKFKTPTLRNIAVTHPYMHDGRFATLEEVVAHYNKGGEPHPNADPGMHSLRLTDSETEDLMAFLAALTDSNFLATPPYLHPPYRWP